MSSSKSIRVFVRFDVEAEQMPELCATVKAFFDEVVADFDGFVRAQFHKSQDNRVFVNFAEWESTNAYQKFLNSDGTKSELARRVLAFHPVNAIVEPISL